MAPKSKLAEQFPDLAAKTFPDASGCTVQLSGGRVLGYQELCDPAIPTEQQPPVLVFIPGSPGTRLFHLVPEIKHQGFLPGWRLLVLDRPGVGTSSTYPEATKEGGVPTYAQFVLDFQEFCAALSLRDVCVLGFSAGTPFALAVAHSCSDLVSRVALVSAIAPPDAPDTAAGMALLFRFGYFACRHMRWLVRWMGAMETRQWRHDPVAGLQESFAPYNAPSDKRALERPEVVHMFLESALEDLSRHEGPLSPDENFMFTRPWGFKLSDIHVPVAVWNGTEDHGCTQGMARYIAGQVAGCKLELVQGAGHMVLFDVWKDVISWLATGRL